MDYMEGMGAVAGGDECAHVPYNSQILPVHAAMLHTGKLLYFSGSGNNNRNFPRKSMAARLWDPATGQIEAVPVHREQRDLFCAGHCFLPDGKLLVAGGTAGYPILFPYGFLSGIPDTFLFDPESGRWLKGSSMSEGRWYPTCAALPDGSALVLSGWRDHLPWKIVVPPFLMINRRVERWDPTAGPDSESETTGRWEDLKADHHSAYYPRLHVVPPGEVLKVGREPETFVFNLESRRWRRVATSRGGPRVYGTSVLLPLEPPDYDVRVMILGGAASEFLTGRATNSVEILRRDGTAYTWSDAPPMSFPRLHISATLLLDGRVLVTGGAREDNSNPVFETELFDPAKGTWRFGATCHVPRLYHSVSILLPDGRVWSGGGNPHPGDEELRIEIYTPGYTKDPDRPKIHESPRTIEYGQGFEIRFQSVARIIKAALLRPSSATHSFNADQRWVGLVFQLSEADRIRAISPPTSDQAPPGWYLLTLVDEQDRPAEAHWVHLS